MKSSKTRKILSIILAVLMLVSSVPATVFAAEESYPVMMATNAASSRGYYRYYNKVYTVTFLDEIKIEEEPLEQWDMSAAGDGSVWGWMYLNEEATAAAGDKRYDVYLAGEGGVALNPTSTHLFYMFENLATVNNTENLKTSGATSFKLMFSRCYDLVSVDLSSWDTSNVTNMSGIFDMTVPNNSTIMPALASINLTGWDTSNVTDMSYMFYNCSNLDNLDLSSFNTGKVTNMANMFYRCLDLENIYIGDGWTVESVNNANAMFNCCYAIVGGKDIYDSNFQYIAPSKEYAKPREEGGFLTYKAPEAPEEYTVTYSFIGDIIPEGVTAPDAVTYEEGTTVTVADNASAEHYIFSGWATEDAEVVNGEFVINNDVHFVGSWTKLYKVEYKYDENYPVPDGAPEIPDVELWYAPGEEVPVYGTPYVPEYVFIGWTTTDAEIIADGFTMPEKDVTIYGYYKKPVESVEFLGGDIELDAGDTDGEKLNVYIKPEDATVKTLTYISGDESVVKVDNNGVITPVGEGTTTVTVQSVDDPTKTDTITVTVKTFVTDIEVDKTEVTLYKGETDKITGTITPDNATNKGVTYFSENEDIVKVDENGNITATGEGTAKIIVSSEDNPDVKKEVTVTVKNPVTEITATEDFTLNVGEEKNVEAKVNEDATEKGITYETSDPGVVKIDNDGNVFAVGEGTAVITVISKDNPEFRETVIVTVKIPVTDITVDEKEITLGKGDKDKINITVTPDDATNKEVTFESGDETVVKVDKDGNIEAVNPGTTTITVTSKDNPEASEVVTVTVVPKYNVYYTITNAEEVGYDEIPAAESYKAGSTVTVADLPELEGYVFVGWETKQVTVVNNEFTMPGGDVLLSGYFKRPVSGVEIQGNEEITLEKNDETTIKVTVTPDDATDKGLTFTSSDETVVKVDEKGKITAVGSGTATITVASKDNPEKTDTITVTVLKEYEVTYEFVGDVIPENVTAPEAKLYSDGKTVYVKNNASAAGYIFSGWNTDDVAVTDGRFVIDRDVHFTGSWTKINYYDVTYEVTGDIPAGYKAPSTETYEEGSAVEVEEIPSADGYIFSGWTSEEADITSGEFDIYNDVVIKGVWTKINYYDVTYEVTGDIPAGYKAPSAETYEEGSTVEVEETPSADGYIFYGWTSEDVVIVNDAFEIYKNVVIKGEWVKKEVPTDPEDPTDPTEPTDPEVPTDPEEPTDPDYTIEAPDGLNVYIGETINVGISIVPDDGKLKPTYKSSDESIVTVDAEGNITGISEGPAIITVDFGNGEIITIPVMVIAPAPIPTKHHIVFGKTDGIGWYEVSVNGGDFFPQGPNSTLEVNEGDILVVRVQDMWIDDEFDFYVNGKKVPMDPANTITVVVDGYMLIGALSMDVEVPDVEESVSLLDKIKNFFLDIINWFKNLFS